MAKGSEPRVSLPAVSRRRLAGYLAAVWQLMSLTALGAWTGFKRLTSLGFPRRFPLVQFPNLPLIVAFVAAQAAPGLRGDAHFDARAVSYLGMTIWAYEELVHGVNWFRRLLGLSYGVIMIVRLGQALHT